MVIVVDLFVRYYLHAPNCDTEHRSIRVRWVGYDRRLACGGLGSRGSIIGGVSGLAFVLGKMRVILGEFSKISIFFFPPYRSRSSRPHYALQLPDLKLRATAAPLSHQSYLVLTPFATVYNLFLSLP